MKLSVSDAAAAGGALIGAAADAVSIGDSETSMWLFFLSGVCAVFGSLFYSTHENESALSDIGTSLIAAFIAGFAIGGFIGSGVIALIEHALPDADIKHIAAFGPHMFGGLVVGAFVVPFFRIVRRWLKRFGGDK